MITKEFAGRGPVSIPAQRLSDQDRAIMLSVAEREFAQGKISVEEYDDIRQRCRVDYFASVRGLFQRFARGSATSA